MAAAREAVGLAAALCLAATALAASVAALAMLEIERSPDAAGAAAAAAANGRALLAWWVALAAGWLALGAAAWRLARRPGGAWSGSACVAVLGVALAARAAVILLHQPALSDDIARYRFDGATLAAGHNPYLATPVERLDALRAARDPHRAERFAGEASLAAAVNHGELATIYLPASQWFFAATDLAASRLGVESGVLLRAALATVELLGIGVILALLRRRGRSPWWATLYAWHPLALAEVAGSGHQDPLGILPMLAALLLAAAAPTRVDRWAPPLALACLVKPMAAVAGLFLLRGQSARRWAGALLLGAAVATVVALPLLVEEGGAPVARLLDTVERFTRQWAHFGSAHRLAEHTLSLLPVGWTGEGLERASRLCCLAGLALVLGWLWRREPDPIAATRAALVAMVLLAPAAHPWYLLWALALVPVTFSPTAWALSLLLPLGYAALRAPWAWQVPEWLVLAAYGPVYAVLAVDLLVRRGRRGRRGPASRDVAASLAADVPVRREEPSP